MCFFTKPSSLLHETKNMKCSSCFLLILLLSVYLSYSSLTILRTNTNIRLVKEESKDHQQMVSIYNFFHMIYNQLITAIYSKSFISYIMFLLLQSAAERDHVQRKALHEVHSGPNPISNSIPQQKWKLNKERNP